MIISRQMGRFNVIKIFRVFFFFFVFVFAFVLFLFLFLFFFFVFLLYFLLLLFFFGMAVKKLKKTYIKLLIRGKMSGEPFQFTSHELTHRRENWRIKLGLSPCNIYNLLLFSWASALTHMGRDLFWLDKRVVFID